MSKHIIQINQLSKFYGVKKGKVEALSNFTLQIEAGEIFGLLGPNGAGKTTAVKLVMGFLHPSNGEIIFDGTILKPANPRTQIGYLPESFRPNPNLTVYEYIKFQCELTATSRISDNQINNLLEMTGMKKFGKRKISQLSKGMGQRVGLAQAFANDPDCLILDEPTSGLDPIGKSEVIELLLDMKKKGKTVFFCSHILSEVEKLCDRIGILVAGHLRFVGSVGDFLTKWNAENLEEAFKSEAQCVAS